VCERLRIAGHRPPAGEVDGMTFADDLDASATAQLLDDTIAFLKRFIVFADDAQPIAIALWVLHTHALDAAECTPYLNVESAEKRSGKSRLLEVLGALARGSVHVANLSEAALFRMLGSRADAARRRDRCLVR
jgi:hypothetical protein